MTHNPDRVAKLFGAAGHRGAESADCSDRVEAAVRLEWQQVVQARIGRRRAGWIVASCLTSVALIALVLHAHGGQTTVPASAEAAPHTRPASPARTGASRDHGPYFRAYNEDRQPDRGIPRHVMASYSRETR